MTTPNDSLQKRNLAIARTWLSTLFEPAWWDLMHEDIVLEFPYGSSIGAKERVSGKAAATEYCKGLMARAGKLKFDPLEITGTTNPGVFFGEYECDRVTPSGWRYRQIYIQKTVVKDGKVIRMREFWDPKKILDAARAG